MMDQGRELFARAVLASLVLHLLALALLPGWRAASLPVRPQPLWARIERPISVAERFEPAEARPARQATSARAGKPAARERPPAVPERAPAQPAMATQSDSAVPIFEAPSARPQAAAAASTEPASPEPATRQAPAPVRRDEGASIAQYRLAVIARARGANRYPRLALENHWQGRAEVRIAIGSAGNVESVALRAGSGYEVLDRQALEIIRFAASQVALPEALRGRAFDLDIPVIFSLQDAPG